MAHDAIRLPAKRFGRVVAASASACLTQIPETGWQRMNRPRSKSMAEPRPRTRARQPVAPGICDLGARTADTT